MAAASAALPWASMRLPLRGAGIRNANPVIAGPIISLPWESASGGCSNSPTGLTVSRGWLALERLSPQTLLSRYKQPGSEPVPPRKPRAPIVPQQLPISVCMISGAEAHRIERALASVSGWVSEIIVVLNQEVNDQTENIARQHGAKVFRESWKGYSAQKNSALEKATQPWILGLDADEEVSPELRQEIASVLTSPVRTGACAAFSFPRLSWYCGRWIRHGDWYPDRKTRLWRNGQARWVGAGLHEKLEASGAIGNLRGNLLHHSMESLEHQIEKTLRYANDFARVCETEGRRVSLLDLVIRPAWRFLRSFILKRGFLDGWQGFTIAWLTAFYTFLRYAMAREARSRNMQNSGGA